MNARITTALLESPDPMTTQVVTSILEEPLFAEGSLERTDFCQQIECMLDYGYDITTDLIMRIYQVVAITWQQPQAF